VGRGFSHGSRRAALVAAAAATLLSAACTAQTPGGQASPSSSPVASSSPSGPTPLTLAVYGDAQTVATFVRMADVWTDAHPDVPVTVTHTADAASAARRLAQQFDAGDAPDLFLTDHDDLAGLVQAGRVQPVDQLLEQRGVLFGDAYQRLGLEAFSADSALQCMPHDVSPLVTFYNADLLKPRTLKTADRPAPTPETGWTWEQYALAARRLSQHGVRGAYIAPDLEQLLPLVRSAGADLVDDPRTPTTLTSSDDKARQALTQVLAVARDRSVVPTPQQLATHSAVDLFEAGKLAMIFGTRRLVPKLREVQGLHFDVLPLPTLAKPRTVATMDGYCINAHTPHLQQAADFLTFASGAEGAKLTAGFGGVVPANIEALHSDAFTDPGADPSHTVVFADALRHADALPFVPGWPQVVADTDPLVARIFTDTRPNLTALTVAIDARSQQVLTPPSASPSP